MKKISNNLILVIVLLGLILRLINIDQSLWFDEAVNVLAAKDLGFWHFVTGYPIGDFHPPGYFSLLWIWTHIFGFSELAVRFPSVLFGLFTIYLSYLIGQKLFNKKTGLTAAFFLAINPLHVYYSQEARMYALAAFTAALSFYYLLKFLDEGKKYFWLYSFSIGLILYSDYLVYLILPAQLLFIIWAERKKFISILLGQLMGFVLLIPWLFISPQQLINGRQTAENVPGWKKVVGGASLKDFLLVYIKAVIGRVSIENKNLYSIVLAVLGIFYGVITFNYFKKFGKESKLLFCWIFLPTLFALIVSFFVPVLSYFRMLFIVPGFCLILAKSVETFGKRFKLAVLIVIILVNFVCLAAYYLNPSFQRENWKGLINFLNSDKNSSLVLFENNDTLAPFKYAENCQQKECIFAMGALKNFPANSKDDVVDLETQIIQSKMKIYLVDYLVEISDPNRVVDKKLIALGYRVTQTYNFPSLGLVYKYEK